MKNVTRQVAILFLIALFAQAQTQTTPPKPAPAPARWLGLIGEYGPDSNILYILEKDGKLSASFKRATPEPLQESSRNVFTFPASGPHANHQLTFTRDRNDRATELKLNDTTLPRRRIEPEAGANQLRVTPVRPVETLIKEALNAQPPAET